MSLSDDEARGLLQDAVRSVEECYRERGIFQEQFGFGQVPAVVVVDLTYRWTADEYAGGSKRLGGLVEATRQLLSAARAKRGSSNSRVTTSHLGQVAVHESKVTSVQKASNREATSRARRRSDRSAQRHPWLLRSIQPTRAKRPFDASVDPTEALL